MTALIGPFQVAALLLAAGGLAKSLRPDDTARALRAFGVPARPIVVRAGGALELLAGVWAITTGARAAALVVALSYAAFAAFVWSAERRDLPIASCGCFGKADTAPSRVHVVLDLAACAVAAGVAIVGGTGLGDVLAAQPLAGVPYTALVLIGAWLAFVALTRLPAVLHATAASRSRA